MQHARTGELNNKTNVEGCKLVVTIQLGEEFIYNERMVGDGVILHYSLMGTCSAKVQWKRLKSWTEKDVDRWMDS